MKFLRKIWLLVCFIGFYMKELIRANIRVAYDALTPTHYMCPAILAVPLDAKTDFEILLLANLITMTPGTLSVDVSTDREVLYVHGMYVEDETAFRAEIKDRLEKRVLELLR